MYKNLVFVSGTARSGTTLLSLVLSAHPDVCICPETNHLINTIKYGHNAYLTGKNLYNLKKLIFSDEKLKNLKIDIEKYMQLVRGYQAIYVKDIIIDFLCFYRNETKPSAKILGQKKNYILFYKELFNIFPESKIVSIFRDCRASVPSAAKNLPGQTLISASRQWAKRAKLSDIIKKEYRENYMEILYEKFVSDPMIHSTEICNFIGIKYNTNMLKHHKENKDLELIPTGQEKKHIRTREPVNANRVETWKNSLNLKQKIIIYGICRKQMINMGYL